MPAEAIHLSALEDSIRGSRAAALLSTQRGYADARLGAVLIDFPYFDRFALGVLRYLAKRPVAVSPWGDAFHQRAPVAIGKGLLRAARRLSERASSRDDGDRVLAVALGYCSHLAVDTVIHPLVNRLAKARAHRLGDTPARQHNEVEKFHSILFHEARFGFDFMGRDALRAHITVDVDTVTRFAPVADAWRCAVTAALDHTPTDRERERWGRGYRQYVALLSSPLGKTLMPDRVKEEVRGEVYDGAGFSACFDEAVVSSRRYLDAALGFAESGDDAAFDAVVPEGSIDDPPARAARA